jgi:hypothetical protein
VEPITLLLGAVTLVKQIKAGCDQLHEGRMAIEEFKKGAERAVGDVKAIAKELTGFWAWVKNLLGIKKPDQAVIQPETPAALPVKKAHQNAEELQAQLIVDIGQKMGEFFDIHQKLKNYYEDLEETSLTVYDPDQNVAKKAMERSLVELQLENLSVEIREAMVYAPPELKDIYSRFLKMYGRIIEEQEFARREHIRKRNEARWLREEIRQRRSLRLALGVTLVGLAAWVWGLMITVRLATRGFMPF